MRLSPLLFVVLLVGCDRPDSSKPVEIGHVHESEQSDDEYKALKLEVEELNKDTSQLPQGRRLQIRHASGGDSPDEWGAQASRLLAVNHVTGLIGGNRWQEAEKIGAAVQSEKAIAISPAGWAGVTISPNLFCAGLAPSERGRVLAMVVREAKPKRIVVIRDPAAKAASLAADQFVKDSRDANTFVSELEVTNAKKIEADVIFFACSAAQTLRLLDLAINQPLLLFGDEDAQLRHLLAAGKNSDRLHVATAYPAGAAPENAFATRFQQSYQLPLTISAALAHDAFVIWVEAARRAGSCHAAGMRAELMKRDKPFDTVTGPLNFADDYTARRQIFVGKLANGLLTDVKTFPPK